jgi:hypothetical protein
MVYGRKKPNEKKDRCPFFPLIRIRR